MNDIIKIEHCSTLAENTVALQWFLTNISNYSCSYCSDFLHNGTIKGPTFPQLKDIIIKFKNHFVDKKLFVELTGGEAKNF